MDRHRTALATLTAALVLGLTWDLLLRWIPWGINVPIWTVLFVASTAGILPAPDGRRAPLLITTCALLAAAGIAWRDSPVLVGLDLVLLVFLLPMLALHARGVRLTDTGLSQIAVAMVTTGVQSVAGFPQLILSDLQWSRLLPRRTNFRTGAVIFRGVLIAIPALVVFGSLLASADPAFKNVLRDVVLFDVKEVILHVLVTGLVAAVCAGFLRSFLFGGPALTLPRPSFLSLPAVETTIAIGLVNLLFAAFVAVQLRYFFGGTVTMRVAGLSYSDYARRGFFELVLVVALALPMLLILDWLVDKRASAAFRSLALIQVALILVIAASAYRRMQLYRDEFGLTQLRLYTTAFMIWLGVLLVWFAATVLTGRRNRFAIGALTTGVAAVVILHAINPDALIVKTNLARAAAGRRAFDAAYALSLSDDAIPALLSQPELLEAFARRPRPQGWRTWNLSRERARARPLSIGRSSSYRSMDSATAAAETYWRPRNPQNAQERRTPIRAADQSRTAAPGHALELPGNSRGREHLRRADSARLPDGIPAR